MEINNEKEIWRDIKGFEDLYKVNNKGIVISKKTNTVKTPYVRKVSGSLYIGLNRNGKTTSYKIDRLLYETFGIESQDIKSIEGELWVDIKGYEGSYKISNYGRVKSLDRYINQRDQYGDIKPRFMKGKILSTKRNNGADYINISLQDGIDKTPQNYYIHILVAEHFIPNPKNLPQVNHKDGNKSNNKVDNLEWCTEKENVKHAIENELMKIDEKTKQHVLRYNITDENIIEIYKLTLEGKYTYQQIADIYGLPRIYIKNIKNKSNKRFKELTDKIDNDIKRNTYLKIDKIQTTI